MNIFHRNRKKNSHGFIFPVPITIFLFVIVVFLLMYMWLDIRNEALGMRIKVLEKRYAEVQKHYNNELLKWQQMKAPSNIESMLTQNKMVMVWPDEISIIRMQVVDGSVQQARIGAEQVLQVAQSSRAIIND